MQAEHLMSQLSSDRSNASRMKAFRSLNECGSFATEEVKCIRGITWWREHFGTIEGIERCMITICPCCNTEIATGEMEKLDQRLFELKASREIFGTTTYSGSMTMEHHHGDRIEKLTVLLTGALDAVLSDPGIRQAMAGGYFALESTTGEGKQDGAHPHIQCFTSLHGHDESSHNSTLSRIHTVFRDFIEDHSHEVLGEKRTVSPYGIRLSSDGPGDEGFYGKHPWSSWNLFCEVTRGFAKDNGFCLSVTPDEYAEVHEVMSKHPAFRAVGMWEFKGEFFPPRRREVIGTIPASQWNRLYPSTKRIIRTVVMDTDHWSDEEVVEYIDIANQETHPYLINYFIQRKLGEDCAKIPDFDRMIVF